ncbi:MAG: cell division protein FtsL [Piscirickettsiaceae bacterium]|nr:cell division protein FtsL [Piscirickettsiaceae bacterium]
MSIADMILRIRTHSVVYLLIALVLISSIAVIYTKHSARTEFIVLQKLEKQYDQLNEEWGRLLLEESTWSGPGQIEQQASLRLNMIVPTADVLVVIKQ